MQGVKGGRFSQPPISTPHPPSHDLSQLGSVVVSVRQRQPFLQHSLQVDPQRTMIVVARVQAQQWRARFWVREEEALLLPHHPQKWPYTDPLGVSPPPLHLEDRLLLQCLQTSSLQQQPPPPVEQAPLPQTTGLGSACENCLKQ